MSDVVNNLDWSVDPIGPDKRSEKQKKDDWVRDQIEFKNPNLQRPLNVRFPPPTQTELERLKNCDIYGNPRKRPSGKEEGETEGV